MKIAGYLIRINAVLVSVALILLTSACAITRDIAPVQAPSDMAPLDQLEHNLK